MIEIMCEVRGPFIIIPPIDLKCVDLFIRFSAIFVLKLSAARAT